MNRFLFGLLSFLFFTNTFAQTKQTPDTKGYEVSATVAPLANVKLYLGIVLWKIQNAG